MLAVAHYEVIRRKVLVDGMSQRAVAKELSHSRKTVRKAMAQGVPPGYRRKTPRSRPVLEPVQSIIEAWLEADRRCPRKQRHTAQRVFERLRGEHGFTGSYSPVQRFVAAWKRRQGLLAAEVFVPLVFAAGEEAQVDWGEATVRIGGQERVLQFFCVRMAFSRATFVRAYERQDQVSFLDGHVRAFEFFGGVPKRLAYDNLKTAVVRVGRGRERDLNAKFVELRNWYLFDTRFCNVASGNEKGHVENLVKRVQRTFLTPLPEVSSLEELNRQLQRDCERELDQTTRDPRGGEARTSRELFAEEKVQLLPLPQQSFAACEEITTRIDKFSVARFENCWYSAPVEWAHQPCVVRGYLDRVEIFCEQACVATHARGQVAEQYVLEPRHYLPLLFRKPGALHNGRPFQGEPFGSDFALLRRELEYRYAADGTQQYLRVLRLLTEHPEADVRAAVARCVALRAFNADAIESALRNAPLNLPASRLDLSDRPELVQIGSGIRLAADYDALFDAQREESVEEAPVEEAHEAHVEEAHVDKAHVEEAHVEEAHVEEAHVEEAHAECPSAFGERGGVSPPVLCELAETTAEMRSPRSPELESTNRTEDAFPWCCSEVELEPEPVPLPGKEEAA